MHGANRLGGNGVAESTVFGGIAGDVMADWVVGPPAAAGSRPRTWTRPSARITAPLAPQRGREPLRAAGSSCAQVMWEHVGLIRAGDGPQAALARDRGHRPARLETRARCRAAAAYNLAWQDWLNLQNQATAAWLIARSALERTESRGSHYRRDFPETAARAR